MQWCVIEYKVVKVNLWYVDVDINILKSNKHLHDIYKHNCKYQAYCVRRQVLETGLKPTVV